MSALTIYHQLNSKITNQSAFMGTSARLERFTKRKR
jgi:hypothetical protein